MTGRGTETARGMALAARANQVFPGLQSNFRRATPGASLFLDRGQGLRVWDVDGKEYLDLVLGMGPAIWGHGHLEYESALREQLARLASVASSTVHTEPELELGEAVIRHVPSAEWVRFGISGTEAVQLAIRLARAYTGRPSFVRFEGHYHGWLDSVFGGEVNPDPDAPPRAVDRLGIPGRTEGRSAYADADSFLIPWNDTLALERTLQRHGHEIGLVLMEPVLCNSGCCPPRPGYLEQVRALCDRHGALLCFDEVITGFRVGLSGAQGHYGVTPDLTVLGKSLAGGMPLSAVAGRRSVLGLLRDGRVLGGGTFNSFPLGVAGGLATMRLLERDDGQYFRDVDRIQGKLMAGLAAAARRHGHALLLQGPRGIFHYAFADRQVAWTPRDLDGADGGQALRLRSLALEEGLLLGGGQRVVVSGVMTDAELDDALGRFDRVFARL